MEVGKLNAQSRSTKGTTANNKTRIKGLIPAICYGSGMSPLQLQLSPSELMKSLDPVKGRNTLLSLDIDNGATKLSVMVKDLQREPVRGELVHADFISVAIDRPVRVTVPMLITGKSEGVKEGGTLHQVYRTIQLSSLPAAIPEKIEVDVTALAIGQSIHVSDLKMPEGVTVAMAATTTLCVVTAPRAEKGAEAGEGAAAAAGDKAASGKTPAPAAAAKPAAGAKPAAAAAKPAAAAAKPAAKK